MRLLSTYCQEMCLGNLLGALPERSFLAYPEQTRDSKTVAVGEDSSMACACQGKVSNTNGRCPACNEAIVHKIPASRHSCSFGNCS